VGIIALDWCLERVIRRIWCLRPCGHLGQSHKIEK
jgi:hypothetical protein